MEKMNHKKLLCIKFGVGLVLLVFLAGCAILQPAEKAIPTPTLQPTGTSTATTTETVIPPTPTHTPVILPPVVVSVQPAPYSLLNLDQPLTIQFNQPVDKTSVEEAFQIQPFVEGKISWLDETTLQFSPDQNYPTTTNFQVSILDTAKAENGLSMLYPIEINYKSVDYLRIGERLPEPGTEGVRLDSAFMITFNQPVNRDGELPITILPELEGKGEWLNESTYVFYPQSPGLAAATQYVVQINPLLTGAGGSPLAPNYLAQDAGWSFSTDAPRLLSVEPADGASLAAYPEFILLFNQPMDSESVQLNLSLQNARGKPIEGEYTWNEQKTSLSFKPSTMIEAESEYSLVLLGLAANQGGEPIQENFAARYTSKPLLILAEDLPETVQLAYDGRGTLSIKFSSPLAPEQNLAGRIDFSPVVEGVQVSLDEADPSRMLITGIFKPGNSILLGVSGDLLDEYGRKMGKDLIKRFKASDLPPTLFFPFAPAGFAISGNPGEALPPIFVPLEDAVLPAITANVRSLNVNSSHLNVEQFIQMTGASNQERLDATFQDTTTWRQSAPQYIRNKTMQVELTFAAPRKTPSTGFYSLSVSSDDLSAEGSYIPSPVLAVISQVQVVAKSDSDQVIAWVYNMGTEEPVKAAPVLVYNSQAEILGGAATDENGLAVIDFPGGTALSGPFFVVVWKPGHPDFGMTCTGWSLSGAGWNQYAPVVSPDDGIVAQVYTDRLQYTPGQTIFFQAVVGTMQDGSFLPIVNMKNVTLNVLGEPAEGETAWRILASIPLELSSYGTAAGSYLLPAGFPEGEYRLQLADLPTPVNGQAAEAVFLVHETNPSDPIEIAFEKTDWVFGDEIKASIQLRSPAGEPEEDLVFQWRLYALPLDAVLPDGDVIGKQQIPLQPGQGMLERIPPGMQIAEGVGKTGIQGEAVFILASTELESLIDKEMNYKLTLVVEPEANPNRQLLSSTIIHAAAYAIRIHSESWGKQVGEEIGFSIQTLDWAGNPSGSHALSAQFRKVIWKPTSVVDPSSGFPLYESIYAQVGSTDFQTDADGQARLVFSPSEPGVYQLHVEGGGPVTEILVWVGGSGSANWSTFPNQTILLASDKQDYRVGDSARILISNPFYGLTYALITVERSQILYSEILSFEGSSYEYVLALTKDYAPNAYVSVILFGRHNDDQPDFRQGYLELPVTDLDNNLEISIQTQAERLFPGQEVSLILQVRDSQGRPVRGEFSLAVMDDPGVINPFAEKLNLMNGFNGSQSLGVFTNNALAAYLRGGLLVTGGRKLDANPLDGVEPMLSIPGQQSLLATSSHTAFWVGNVETDENGMAEVRLTLPDTPADWLVDVRGVSVTGAFGEARLRLEAYDDLELSIIAPDTLNAGDGFRIEGYVFNRTQQEVDLVLALEGKGILLDDANQQGKQVKVGAGKQEKVVWWGVVSDTGAVELKLNAQSMDQQLSSEVKKEIMIEESTIQIGSSFAGLLLGEEMQAVFGVPAMDLEQDGVWKLILSPSLPSAMVELAQKMDQDDNGQVESLLSEILALLEMRNAFMDQDIQSENLRLKLENIPILVKSVLSWQNQDGGWGWYAGGASDDYLTALAYYGLSRVDREIVEVDPFALQKGEAYVLHSMRSISAITQPWQYDLLAFQYFALSGSTNSLPDINSLAAHRGKMSSWAKALLALSLETYQPGNASVKDLVDDLLATLQVSSEGAFWQDTDPIITGESVFQSMHSTRLNTAIVLNALSRLKVEGVPYPYVFQYLLRHQSWGQAPAEQPVWVNSYEIGWIITAMAGGLDTEYGQTLLDADLFTYSTAMNGISFLNGESDGRGTESAVVLIPLEQLDPNLNQLQLTTSSPQGWLFYQSQMLVKPTELLMTSENRGISISRYYTLAGKDCRVESCKPLETFQIGNGETPFLVNLELVVLEDSYRVMVQDQMPAGLKVLVRSAGQGEAAEWSLDPANPFKEGWGEQFFSQPIISGGFISWYADYLPAGTYTLVYRVLPVAAGEFLVQPARVVLYYSPQLGGNSPLEIIKINP